MAALMKIKLLLLALLAILIIACGGNPSNSSIEVSEAWARVVPMQIDTTLGAADATTSTQMSHAASGGLGAVYMTIRNNGDVADQLIKVSSKLVHVAELHSTEEKDGMMSMHPVEAVEIPANGEQTLQPGGFHIMLIGVMGEVKTGETIQLMLTFAQAGEVTIEAEVKEQ